MKTLTKTYTHTARVRDLDISIQGEVCLILGITDEFYCQDQYRAYEHFTLVCCSESHMKTVRYSKIFRGFWNNEWAQRNQSFLRMIERHFRSGHTFTSEQAYDAYLNYNSTENLINDEDFMARVESVMEIIKNIGGRL